MQASEILSDVDLCPNSSCNGLIDSSEIKWNIIIKFLLFFICDSWPLKFLINNPVSLTNYLNSVVANATKQGYLPPCQPSFDDICMRITK